MGVVTITKENFEAEVVGAKVPVVKWQEKWMKA